MRCSSGFRDLFLSSACLALLHSGCSESVCSDGGECTVLTVEGSLPNTPTRVEFLDAAGRRLGRYRTTTTSPERRVQIRPDGFSLSEVACIRVRSGDVNQRMVALVPISASDPLTPRGRSVTLSAASPGSPAPLFEGTAYPLDVGTVAHSVAIGVLPHSNIAVVYVGVTTNMTTLASAVNVLEFKDVQPSSFLQRQQLSIGNFPPFPLFSSRSDVGGQDLVISRYYGTKSTKENENWPIIARGRNGEFDGSIIHTYDDIPSVLSSGHQATYVSLAHLNNDNKFDLIINYTGASDSGVLVAMGQPGMSATFDVGKQPIVKGPADDLSSSVFLGKQQDGSLAIAVSLGFTVQSLAYDPTRQSASPTTLLDAMEALTPLGLAAGDFDGDERTDLAATINVGAGPSIPDNRLRLWTGRDSGGFQAAIPSQVTTSGKKPRVVTAGDLNGDQIDDLVTADYGTGALDSSRLSLWLGGSSTAMSTDLVAKYGRGILPTTLLDVAVGDINGDCKLDIVAVSESDPNFYVFINKTP